MKKRIKGIFENKPVKITAIAVGGVLLAAVIVSVVFGFIAKGEENIFPHVTASGIDLGGLTVDEAAGELEAAGLPGADSVKVTVQLTKNISFDVLSADTGVNITAGDAAQSAYEYGRNGGFVSNGFKYLGALISKPEIHINDINDFDEENVRKLVENAADEANSEKQDSTYKINEKSLTVTKGSDKVVIDPDDLYNVVFSAFKDGNYSKVEYKADITPETGIDFEKINEEIFAEPENSVYDKETGEPTKEKEGVSLDIAAAQKQFDEAKTGDKIEIPFTYTEPEITAEKLSEMLFRDQLSSRSTDLSSSSSNRITNVTLAANAINGTVLNPGDTFSYNDVVGPRTAERGYKGAAAYVGGKTVESTGGGICQVSSTLYTCVLYADLEVVSRTNHGYAVSYLPLGMDATVSWGSLDFKFKNDTDYPVKIEAYVSGVTLTVKIYGTKTTDDYIEIESVCLRTMPYDTITKEDDSLSPGETELETSGYTGYVSETYRCLYDKDGNLIDRSLITKDTYSKRDKVILEGPSAPEPEPAKPADTKPKPGDDTSTSTPSEPETGGDDVTGADSIE